jgi:hypothetical protein
MPKILIGLAFLGAVGAVAAFVLDQRNQSRSRQNFEARIKAKRRILVEGTDSVTTVYIFRDVDSHVMDRTVVARIPKGDPDWRNKVQDAQVEARARIDVLEASP